MTDKIGWERTLIKSMEIKWKHKMRIIADGELDLDLHIPLTDLFKAQAKIAYVHGVFDMLKFQAKQQGENKTIEVQDLYDFFINAGYPEIAARFKEEGKNG